MPKLHQNRHQINGQANSLTGFVAVGRNFDAKHDIDGIFPKKRQTRKKSVKRFPHHPRGKKIRSEIFGDGSGPAGEMRI